MTFEDLHIMQQLYLTVLYTEGTMKPTIKDDDKLYHDEINNVDIRVTDLKENLSWGWVLFLDEKEGEPSLEQDIHVHYEVSKHRSLNAVQFFMSAKLDGENYDHFDRFGLASKYRLYKDVETEFTKLKKLVAPFVETDEGAKKITKLVNRFLEGIKKAKTLPTSFFESIAMDVPAKIILDQIGYITQYSIHNAKVTHRRYTPIITALSSVVYLIDYEKKPSASMKVTLGHDGEGILIELTSTDGTQEGGSFKTVSEEDINTTINTSVDLLTTIVNDCKYADEYKPLLGRFLQYFNEGVKHVKINIRM